MKFNRYALSDLATIKYGKNQKKVLSESGNIPIYGTGGLMGYATTALYDKPSVLIGRKGTIGKVKYVEHPFWTVDTLFYTIVNTDIVLPKYLYYVMSLIDLNNYNEGTTIPSLRTETLSRLEFDIPSLEEQETILSCLNPIDEKIALNNAINENLEQQIEAIFNNKYAPSLCCPNWGVGTIGDVVTLQRGYDLPRDKMVSGFYPVAGSTDTIFYHNEYTTEAPCVVMGRSGNIGKPRLYMERCWAHNTTLFVKDFKGNNPYWSYYMLRSIDYSQFRGGSAVPTLNRNHVHSFEISIPPVNQQNEFAEIILPLLLLIENNRKEIKRLSTLRQALLPKLMAGEIDISDIDL